MKLNGEARRRVPYGTQAGACSLKVPLFTDSPEGEWLEGLIRVPARLARATARSESSSARLVSKSGVGTA